MSLTVGEMIGQVRRSLHGSSRPIINFVGTTMTDSITSLTAGLPLTGVATGTWLNIGDELLWVQSAAGVGAIVHRGMLGTTPASHASGALIEINSRFSSLDVREKMAEELRSYGEKLFRTSIVNIDTDATMERAYNLPITDPFFYIVDVRVGSGNSTVREYNRTTTTLDRHAATAVFPSGQSLTFDNFYGSVRDVQVTYAREFDTSDMSDGVDLVDDMGLPGTALDVVRLGTMARMVQATEVSRTIGEGQAEPRRADEVPAGSRMATAKELWRSRNERLAQEHALLLARWPYRME